MHISFDLTALGRPVPGLDVTDEMLREFTARHELLLPSNYLGFLKAHNGGSPYPDCFAYREAGEVQYYHVNMFYSIGGVDELDLNVAIHRWSVVLGTNCLPIAYDGGGGQFYIDLKDGSVWLFVHDLAPARKQLANSFETFVSGFVQNPDFT